MTRASPERLALSLPGVSQLTETGEAEVSPSAAPRAPIRKQIISNALNLIVNMELLVIQNKIYDIRGYKVMLDFDLAMLYEVETRVLNQAVKRNIKRFPTDFMFQLNK
ncbi:MAG: ORF6N domain-containing protein, partial [Bacteroidales bacterium]|nr:ORF6N domain-containing protein [Bacteroidales bacterium]